MSRGKCEKIKKNIFFLKQKKLEKVLTNKKSMVYYNCKGKEKKKRKKKKLKKIKKSLDK